MNGAQLVTLPEPLEVIRPFSGYLAAPNLGCLPELPVSNLIELFAFSGQQIILELTEPISEGMLVLVADQALFDIAEDFFGIRVFDDAGRQWTINEIKPLTDGLVAAVFLAPFATVNWVAVSYPVGKTLGVVGLGGVTLSARQAASRENQAIGAGIARQLAAAAGRTLSWSTRPMSPTRRVILDPGRLYRIDINMSWSGEISIQDKTGQKVVQEIRSNETMYTPAGSQTRITTNRQLFFKTTPKPGDQPRPKYGDEFYIAWLRGTQDVFEPEMLERYLAGYDPAQSEEFRFCDDPVRAHFHQDHVAALGLAYGFDVKVATRRVDKAGAEYAQLWEFGGQLYKCQERMMV